jgi:hypothetical protein
MREIVQPLADAIRLQEMYRAKVEQLEAENKRLLADLDTHCDLIDEHCVTLDKQKAEIKRLQVELEKAYRLIARQMLEAAEAR